MADVPSPVIPLVIVIGLWLVVYGHNLMNSVSILSRVENTAFTFALLIPLFSLLAIHFVGNSSITLPIALVVFVYLVSKMLLGPLVLVLAIYLASMYVPSLQRTSHRREADNDTDHARDENSDRSSCWGASLIFLMFLLLYNLFYDGEGYECGLALVAVLLFIFCNLLC